MNQSLDKIYEIHITTETNDVEKFKKDCFIIGVKPIIIKTETYDGKEGLQVMTSSKYSDGKYFLRLKILSEHLIKLGYNILRQKIEVVPFESKKRKGHLYYESHFRLQLYDINERILAIQLCKQFNFHLSKNVLKTGINFDLQICTYRSYEDVETFRDKIELFKSILIEKQIKFDKVEVEECIYDTNEIVDATWLK